MSEPRRRMTGEERREGILDAALALFSEKGFRAATTRELAARAGITEAMIYRHFRSKLDVLRGVIERDSFLPEVCRFTTLDPQASLREQLIELGRNWRRTAFERRALLAIFLNEFTHEPEMAQSLRETLIQRALGQLVQALADHGGAHVPRARLETGVRLFFASLLWHFVLEERMGTEAHHEESDRRLCAAADLVARALES